MPMVDGKYVSMDQWVADRRAENKAKAAVAATNPSPQQEQAMYSGTVAPRIRKVRTVTPAEPVAPSLDVDPDDE